MAQSAQNISERWFTQVLDHFSLEGQSKTWQQRYFVNPNFVTNADNVKVAIVYIGGEGQLSNAPGGDENMTDVLGQIATNHNAPIYALEHRFYGLSQPFQNDTPLSTEHLKYLNTRQALDDLVNFVQSIDEEQCQLQNQSIIPGKTCVNWIVVGGSYAGALTAWAIQQYDWLFTGAISSSGVVNTQDMYPDFDSHTFTAADIPCGPNMMWAMQEAEYQLSTDNKSQLLDHFNASDKNLDDFKYFLADSALMALQYGDKRSFCGGMDISVREFMAGLDFLVAYMEEMDYKYTDYDRDALKDATSGSARPWLFQTCTELGYFQPAPAQNSIRSTKINPQYFSGLCNYVFGVDITNVTRKALQMYGGTAVDDERTFFSNFWQDIWHIAGVSDTAAHQSLVKYTDVGHCADLYEISDDDPAELTQVRTQEINFIDQLLVVANTTLETEFLTFK